MHDGQKAYSCLSEYACAKGKSGERKRRLGFVIYEKTTGVNGVGVDLKGRCGLVERQKGLSRKYSWW